MKRALTLRTTWFGLALLFLHSVACAATPTPAKADEGSVLVLGRISDDPKAHYEQLKPLLDYVVPRMRNVGITEGRILMARDTQQMTSYLRRGRVDWVTETSGTGMQLQRRAGAKPLLLTSFRQPRCWIRGCSLKSCFRPWIDPRRIRWATSLRVPN